MKQIIKLIDVDGCGTNEETTIQAEGKQKLSNEIIQGIKDTIKKYKRENDGVYHTNSIVNVVCDYLETEGYMCNYVSADVTIGF